MGPAAARPRRKAALSAVLLVIVVASALWAAAEEGLQLAQHSEATRAEEHPHTHRERRHARMQHRGRDSGGDAGAKHRRAARPAFHATAADAMAAFQWADRSKYGGTLVNRGDSLADLPGLRPPARRPDLAQGNATAPADGDAAKARGKGSIKARMHEVDAPPDATCLARAPRPTAALPLCAAAAHALCLPVMRACSGSRTQIMDRAVVHAQLARGQAGWPQKRPGR